MLRVVAVTVVVLADPASADVRSFTRTYEYSTQPEGRTAVELWHTQGLAPGLVPTAQFYEGRLEIEHGITEHLDAGFVTTFAQLDSGGEGISEPFRLDTVRLELRYRFADRGEWPADLQLLVAGAKHFGPSKHDLHVRAIAARDFDRWLLAANVSADVLAGADRASTDLVVGWAAGLAYSMHAKVRLGAETWGQAHDAPLAASAGPVLTLSPSSTFWITATAGFGLEEDAPDFEARAIVGLEL